MTHLALLALPGKENRTQQHTRTRETPTHRQSTGSRPSMAAVWEGRYPTGPKSGLILLLSFLLPPEGSTPHQTAATRGSGGAVSPPVLKQPIYDCDQDKPLPCSRYLHHK